MDKKWNSGEILKFLEHIRKYPVLWDTTHSEYRNKSLKDEAYAEFLTDLLNEGFPENITANYLKDKLKNIRDTYAVEVKKVLACLAEGKEYRPRLLWFEKADAFLRPSFTRKKHISKLSRLRTQRSDQLTENSTDEIEFSDNSLHEKKNFPNFIKRESTENATTPVEKLSDSFSASFSADMDEYDYFGKIVAITLRRLNQEDAWKAEDEISQILRKYKRKKQQVFSEFIEISPEHLLSDTSSVSVNNSSSTVYTSPNLESTAEVSSMCLENEDVQPAKRACIKIFKAKSVEDPLKSSSNQTLQRVYLV